MGDSFSTPFLDVGALLGGQQDDAPGQDPTPNLAFDVGDPVGHMNAPAARMLPSGGESAMFPQFHETPPIASLLMPQPGGPAPSWKETLFKSLAAGLGSYAAGRAGLNPMGLLHVAQNQVEQHDVDRYKSALVNAQMLRQQQATEDAAREHARAAAVARLNLVTGISSHIDALTSSQQIEQYKALVRDYVAPLGVDVDQFPTMPSIGALQKMRKGYQETFNNQLKFFKDSGLDISDPNFWDPKNPNSPSVQVTEGGPAIKIGDLGKLAFGVDYDPTKLTFADDSKFTGQQRVLADKLAAKKYGAGKTWKDLNYDELQQIFKDTAESRHITINTGGGDADIETQAQMVADGNLLPSQLSKKSGSYNSIIARADRKVFEKTGKHLNVLKTEADYRAALSWAASMNGAHMITFNGLADSVLNTLGDVQDLAGELQQGGVQKWNSAKLSTLTSLFGNTPYSETARKYVAAVNTLKEEFANLASGGYAPTESAWKLADQQINGDFGVRDLTASLDEVKRLINYRVTAIPKVRPISAYDPAPPPPAPLPGGPATVPGGVGTGGPGTFKLSQADVGKPFTTRSGQRVVILTVDPSGMNFTSRPAKPGE